MKQSDTPLGKAYVKAKGAGTPTAKEDDDSFYYHDFDEPKDVSSRRYEKIQSFTPGKNFGMQVTYDRVKDQLMYQVYDQKTQKRTTIQPFTNAEDVIRKVVLDAAKLNRGQPVTDSELKKIEIYVKGMAKNAAGFGKPKTDDQSDYDA